LQKMGTHLFLLSLLSLWPLATESVRFWQLDATIEIKVQKNSPPYQAFKQVRGLIIPLAKTMGTPLKTTNLSVDQLPLQNIQTAKKIVLLEPVVVQKLPNLVVQQPSVEPMDLDWINTLPVRQKVRLEVAQARYAVLSEDQKEEQKSVANPALSEAKKIESSQVTIVKTSKGYHIRGPWEISGGLGMTNDHHVDLLHSIEGSTHAKGEVSIKDGTYTINVDSLSGSLIATMYDKNGAVLGEGNLALQEEFAQSGKAPKLIIRPQGNSISGHVASPYDSGKSGTTVAGVTSLVFAGDGRLDKSNEETFEMAGVAKNSPTVGRFQAPNYMKSNTILIAGREFKALVFPEKMIKALKEIVSEQLSYDLNNPDLPVVWGQVLLDGKPISGAQVEMESAEDAKIVYFDVINLPDTKLKETSANGYFAIIGAHEGFRALIAKRGGEYYAHNVVALERGTVSSVQLESTLKTKNVPLRVFDAFSGEPMAANVEMQSLESPLHIDARGWNSILLPEISRMSLMQVHPDEQTYLPAQYIYQDDQDYIHIPLIPEDWLMQILQPKWNLIDAEKGTVVGFVKTENFEVYIAGDETFSPENITYFDAQGNRTLEGVKGGGFIINNLEPDTHEIVVYGKESQKLASRLLPVDERSVSVVTYHEN
jgi:uncharacterized GH25 family protein